MAHRVTPMALALVVALPGVLAPGPARSLDWSVAAGGGAHIPLGTGTLQEGIDTGACATALVSFGLGRRLALAGRFAVSRFPRDDAGVVRKSGIEQRPLRVLEMSGGDLTLIQGQMDARFFPSPGAAGESIRPYVLASAGLASVDLDPTEFLYAYAGHTWPARVPGLRGTHFVVGFGAGLRFDVRGGLRLHLEGRYEIIIRDDSLRSIPLLLEIAYGG